MSPRLTPLQRLFWMVMSPEKGVANRPTAGGIGFIIIMVLLSGAAYNSSGNVLFFVLSIQMAVFILSGILAWINFRGNQWDLVIPGPHRAGWESHFRVEVHNRKNWLPTWQLGFTFLLSGKQSHEASPPQPLQGMHIPPQTVQPFNSLWIPGKRGVFQLKIGRVNSPFPFSLFFKSVPGVVGKEVTVWPARWEWEGSPKVTGGYHHPDGARTLGHDQGTDLQGIREYARGDHPRNIHWKATAKTGKLLIRETANEQETGYLLYSHPSLFSTSDSLFEKWCSVTATVAEDLFRSGQLKRILLAGEGAFPIPHQRHLEEFLDHLAALDRSERQKSDLPPPGKKGLFEITRGTGDNRITILCEGRELCQL